MKGIRLETLLKWILLALATCLAFFIMGTRFYHGYGDIAQMAEEQLGLLAPILSRSERPEALKLVKDLPYWRIAADGERGARRVPLADGSFLSLSPDRGVILDSLVEENRSLMVMTMIVLFTAVEIAAFLAYSVTRPLRRLAWGFAQLSEGRSVRLPACRLAARELSLVTGEFNEMAGQIDRWRAVQQRFARVDRLAALGEMASGIAHEIRNPLASMTIHLDLLRSELEEDDPRMERIAVFDAELARMGRSIDRFLVFAKGGSWHRERVGAKELLLWCARMLEISARKQGVEVAAEAGEDEMEILGAPDELRQLLLNLALNALQAMPDGGRLLLRAAKEDGWIALSVEDTGRGVPEDLRGRIFEPFVTTRSDGTGLGLAISRRIAEDHGGALDLESPLFIAANGEAGGSRFIVRIPKKEGEKI